MSTRGGDAKSDEHTGDLNPSTIESYGLLDDEKQGDGTKPSPQDGREGEKLYRLCVEQIGSGEITPHRVIDQLDTALNLGLSPEDTVKAHILLGNEWNGLDNGTEATLHYDCALEFAQKHRGELDAELLSIFYRNISARYIVQAKRIRSKEGLDHAFVYLDAKQGLLNDGASPGIYLELGDIYDEKSPFDFDKIAFYYEKATECAVLDGDDEDKAAVLTAREKLRIMEKQRAHLGSRKGPHIISALPWRKSHRKVALIAGLGMLVLVAVLIARPYMRSIALHRPVNDKSRLSVENQEAYKQSKAAVVQSKAAVVQSKAAPPAVRSKIPKNTKTTRRSVVHNVAARPNDRLPPKAQEKSFVVPDRWGWPDILP